MGKKIAFLLALCGLVVCIIFSWDIPGQNDVDGTKGLQYKLTEDRRGYIVRDIGWAEDRQIVVPSEYRNKPVVAIGKGAFSSCEKIISISIPDSVTSIGDGALSDCTNLETVVWSQNSGLKTIGHRAFASSGLVTIDIPDGVTTIGEYAFYECEQLKKVSLGDNVTDIGGYAFCECPSLTAIALPKGLTEISMGAFFSSGLSSIEIPFGVTRIWVNAFTDCHSLISITIPSSVTEIDTAAFSFCKSLKKIYFDGSKEQWGAIKKGKDWNRNTASYTVYCTDGNLGK